MKILNACLLTLFILACGQTALSQTKKPQTKNPKPRSKPTATKSYPNAKTQANQLNDAVLSGDYEKVADLTYPKLVQLIGGRARYLEVLKSNMNEMQSGSFQIMSTVAGEAKDVIEVGADVYAIVPTTMKIKVPEGILVGESAMIGVSKDRGAHWTFVDVGNGLDAQRLKLLFPAVADRLKLPEQKRPVLQQGPQPLGTPVMSTQTLPPVFLNHFYLVIDSATFKDIEQSAFLRREFAVTEQRTTVRTDMSYTGLYFYGTNTYFEFFDVASDTSRRIGGSGIAFGVDRTGELKAVAASLDQKLITRKYNSKQVPWFYAAEHKDLTTDSSLGVWLMEYHPSFLDEWNPRPGASNQGTSRKQILQRYKAVLEDAPHETYFEDVIALTLAIDEAQRKTFIESCKQLGYSEHAANVLKGPDLELRLLPQTAESRGIQEIIMRVRTKPKDHTEFRFGTRSVLTFRDDGLATWSF